jgi:phosphate transport system ATP-binding protein
VSDPAPDAVRREAPAAEDPMSSHEPTVTPARPVAHTRGEAMPQRRACTVTVAGLNAWYGDQHSIKDLTLTFAANKATALIGPSGSGKSTVVRCVNRMHEEIPGARASGRILLDDVDV